MAGVAIKNLTRRPHASRALFSKVAKNVLPRHDLSLVFVGPAKAKQLNKKLRNKDYVPNVLSYSLGKTDGEIIICLAEAQKQAASYQMSERTFVLYLFIHGLLHLKGWAHGGTMERCERALLSKFAGGAARPLPHETTHRDRNRHRHVPSKDGRRRGARR